MIRKEYTKAFIGAAVLALNICCTTVRPTGTTNDQTVSILSYNVRNCRGLDNSVDYQRVANVITRIGADVVALQELDSATSRSKGISVLHELARLTGMIPTYRASISFQGGKYGVGILTKEKPVNIESMSLPGKEEERSMLLVEMKNYALACSHFSLTEADRMKSFKMIDQFTSKYNQPVFLAGDLNDTPGSQVIKAFSTNWQLLSDTTQLTIPADHPKECIDYIMLRKNNRYQFKVVKTAVENEPLASDHLPVWTKVSIEKL